MKQTFLIALTLSVLAGCADDVTLHPRHAPPEDPKDYHGVPTDTRPPQILDAPGGTQSQ
jgi:hypothetical protein